MMKRQIRKQRKITIQQLFRGAKLLILQRGVKKLRQMKKTDSFYLNFESKSLPKDVDGQLVAHLESSLNVG